VTRPGALFRPRRRIGFTPSAGEGRSLFRVFLQPFSDSWYSPGVATTRTTNRVAAGSGFFVAVAALLTCVGFAAAAGASPVPRTPPSITVSGTGKVVYVPDVGYITVGVSSEAWQKNEAIVRKIFDALKKLGVEEKNLKTSNISVQPRYLHRPNEKPEFLGYTVGYDLHVTVRQLDRMGLLLDSMVVAGANRNTSIGFGCSKADELLDEARKKADLYTLGAGARVGNVLAISDTPGARRRIETANRPTHRDQPLLLPFARRLAALTALLLVSLGLTQLLQPGSAWRPDEASLTALIVPGRAVERVRAPARPTRWFRPGEWRL
jgi:uncharacterized protein YggE